MAAPYRLADLRRTGRFGRSQAPAQGRRPSGLSLIMWVLAISK